MRIILERVKVWSGQNPLLSKIYENISWLLFERAIRMLVGLFVGVWLARYLGPAGFGQLSFAIAFVSLFSVISTMGLNTIIVRDLVKSPEDVSGTLGAAMVILFFGSAIASALAIIVAIFMQADNPQVMLFIVILSIGLLFKPAEIIRYWFEAQVCSRYIVWVESGVILISAGIKGVMILADRELLSFVWLALAEAAAISVGFVCIYFFKESDKVQWSVSFSRVALMLQESWPVILSGVAIIVYMRTDQLMIGEMLGDEAVGIYSAALRISELWYIVPIVIVGSVAPMLIEMQGKDENLYNIEVQKYFDRLILASLAATLLVVIGARWLISGMFGLDYVGGAAVLQVHVWTGVFVAMGVLSNHWFLVRNLNKLLFYRALLGALVNVLLNVILIPKYGVVGAAWATLVSQMMSAYIFDCISSKSRALFYMKSNLLICLLRKF